MIQIYQHYKYSSLQSISIPIFHRFNLQSRICRSNLSQIRFISIIKDASEQDFRFNLFSKGGFRDRHGPSLSQSHRWWIPQNWSGILWSISLCFPEFVLEYVHLNYSIFQVGACKVAAEQTFDCLKSGIWQWNYPLFWSNFVL